MIEVKNPDIDVDELMARIQEEVDRRHTGSLSASQPPAAGTHAGAVNWTRIHAGLQRVAHHARAIDAVPEWGRFGRFRRGVARACAKAVLYLTSFILNQLKQLHAAVLQSLEAVTDSLRSLENSLAVQSRQIDTLEQTQQEEQQRLTKELTQQAQHLSEIDQGIDGIRHSIAGLEQNQHEQLTRLVTALAERDVRLDKLEQGQEAESQRLESVFIQRDERLAGIEEALNTLGATMAEVGQGRHVERQQLARLEETVATLRTDVTELIQGQQGERQRQESARVDGEKRVKELERALLQLKTDLILQDRRIAVLLEEARRRLPEPFNEVQLQVLADESKHRLDALYVSFEDQFRGTRKDIKEHLRVYLPFIQEAGCGTENMSILDVGCGRGEWLEVLREEGLPARGLDINRVLVEQCQQQGFEVIESDAIAYLRTLPDTSIGAITGFHLLEHLPLDFLIQLLDETVRVLKPGGVAIFETPNPQNILVGSCNFYMDPTHHNPLPSPMLRFLAEARGLCRVSVLDLHPYPEAFQLDGSELATRFNQYFYGPQDYAIIGWKV